MNIKEAKEQIKNAMTAYFTKDKTGAYIIPVEKQRPVFLMGPPGIGKTAVMEQVASEMGVGLLSYSMTHHTRQSALGLPFIEHKNYDSMECDISEYTMSEIIASVYDMMQETGVKEGILFLDEINCVSETLSPVMLQFLQYKVFGRHRVPDGWIVVTAGNPPEYNNSVREFDIATWDRLKRIDVEPDYNVWKEYAYQKNIHPAVLTYLEIKKADFYTVESTVDGKSFVTARGWDDLSQMIRLYEMNNLPVDKNLIAQYLQNKRIAADFTSYYGLFVKYKSDYQIDKILSGKAPDKIMERAGKAGFDERLSLIGLLLDAITDEIKDVMQTDNVLKDLTAALIDFKSRTAKQGKSPSDHMSEIIKTQRAMLESGRKSGVQSKEDQAVRRLLIKALEFEKDLISGMQNGSEAFEKVKKDHSGKLTELKKKVASAKNRLSNMFKFCEDVFKSGQEMFIIVSELTVNPESAEFIGKYGCDEYFRHNKDLLIYDRQKEIDAEIEMFDLSDGYNGEGIYS